MPLEKQNKTKKNTRQKDTTLHGCDEMPTAESEPGVFSWEGLWVFPPFFSFGIPWRRSARRVRAELMPFRGVLVSLEIHRELPQRNLHLPWGVTASQQRSGKRSHPKDSSGWRQRREEKKTNVEWTKWKHNRTQTGNSEFLLSLSHQEQHKDGKEVAQIHGFTFFLMFSIKIWSANANKRSWKATDSLTALGFIQGTLWSLVQRFRHKEEYVFLKKQLSKRLAGSQGLSGLALLVLAVRMARSAHVKWQ